MRPTRDHESPSNQSSGITWPAGLDRKSTQINVVRFPNDGLACGAFHVARRHIPERAFELRHFAERIAQALRRLGLLQRRQQFTDVPQSADIRSAHRARNTPDSAEQVAEYRNLRAGRPLEKERRSARAQNPVADFRHFEVR